MGDEHERPRSKREKGPVWGPLTFLATLLRIALEWYRHW